MIWFILFICFCKISLKTETCKDKATELTYPVFPGADLHHKRCSGTVGKYCSRLTVSVQCVVSGYDGLVHHVLQEREERVDGHSGWKVAHVVSYEGDTEDTVVPPGSQSAHVLNLNISA